MIKDVLRTMWGLLYLLRHMKDLLTDEQLKDLGIEPTRYSSPPPWVFNQRRVDSAGARRSVQLERPEIGTGWP